MVNVNTLLILYIMQIFMSSSSIRNVSVIGYTAMSPHIGYPGIGAGEYPSNAYGSYSAATYACGYSANAYPGAASGYSQSPCYNMPPPPPQHSKLSSSSKEDR